MALTSDAPVDHPHHRHGWWWKTLVVGFVLWVVTIVVTVFTSNTNLVPTIILLALGSLTVLWMGVAHLVVPLFTGANIPAWPVGITIGNNPPSTSCFNATSFTYGTTCFDTFNVITTDSATAPARPSGDVTGASDANVNTMGTVYLKPITAMTGAQLNAFAATYKTGDQILFITQPLQIVGGLLLFGVVLAAGMSWFLDAFVQQFNVIIPG